MCARVSSSHHCGFLMGKIGQINFYFHRGMTIPFDIENHLHKVVLLQNILWKIASQMTQKAQRTHWHRGHILGRFPGHIVPQDIPAIAQSWATNGVTFVAGSCPSSFGVMGGHNLEPYPIEVARTKWESWWWKQYISVALLSCIFPHAIYRPRGTWQLNTILAQMFLEGCCYHQG